jgi:hypothetical protein
MHSGNSPNAQASTQQCVAADAGTLQDAAQMADWAKQVVNLSRELGVYKNQCAHHYEAWIRATQLLQVQDESTRRSSNKPEEFQSQYHALINAASGHTAGEGE